MPRKTAPARKPAPRPRQTPKPKPVAPAPHVRPDADWTITETLTANGREVVPGTELTITGEGATRFVFVRLVARPDGREWIDTLETYKGTPQAYRSFRPDRIKTVHRITKARPKPVRAS